MYETERWLSPQKLGLFITLSTLRTWDSWVSKFRKLLILGIKATDSLGVVFLPVVKLN